MVRTKLVPFDKKIYREIMYKNQRKPVKKAAIEKMTTRGSPAKNATPENVVSNSEEEEDMEVSENLDNEETPQVEADNQESISTISADEEDTAVVTRNKPGPASSKTQIKLNVPELNVDKKSEKDEETPKKSASGKKKSKESKEQILLSDSDDEDSAVVTKSGKIKHSKPSVKAKRSRTISSTPSSEQKRPSRHNGKQKSPSIEEDPSDAEDESESANSDSDFTVGYQKKKKVESIARKGRGRPTKRKNESEDEDDSDPSYTSSSVKGVRSVKRKTRKIKRKSLAESEDSDDSEEEMTKRGYGNLDSKSSKKSTESRRSSNSDDDTPLAKRKSARRTPKKAEQFDKTLRNKSKKLQDSDYDYENKSDDESEVIELPKKTSAENSTSSKQQVKMNDIKKSKEAVVVLHKTVKPASTPARAKTPTIRPRSLREESAVRDQSKKAKVNIGEDEEYIDLKKLHLTREIELMDLDIYVRKLDALAKERELKLEPSAFTVELTDR